MNKTKLCTLTFGMGLLLLAASCSVSKSAMTQRKLINGTWSLTDIDYENNEGTFSSVLFNDAKDICFEGSTWYFLNNNSTGRYSINSGSLCQGGDRLIRWSVVEPADRLSQLQFKFIDEKRKDLGGGFGYRLDIANLTENQMTLKSNVSVEGEPITVVYKFTKQQ